MTSDPTKESPVTLTPRADTARREIGRQLGVRRVLLGLTQRDVANRIASQQGLISDVETGKRTPYLDTVIAIARALGLRVALVDDQQAALLDLTADEAARALAAVRP